MRITISGPPGSGKTTACTALAERLGLESVVFGRVFRRKAEEAGMTLAEFGRLAEEDPSIDESIDSELLRVARENEDIIIESRLSAQMLTRHGIPAFRIYLNASPETRAARLCERDGGPTGEVARQMVEREVCEADRYLKYYDIDLGDRSVYDLVLDTDGLSPEEVVDALAAAVGEWYDVG